MLGAVDMAATLGPLVKENETIIWSRIILIDCMYIIEQYKAQIAICWMFSCDNMCSEACYDTEEVPVHHVRLDMICTRVERGLTPIQPPNRLSCT